MGLRLEQGIDVRKLERLSGRPLRETLNAKALTSFEEEGWIDANEQNLRATAAGFARLNTIIGALLEPGAPERPLSA